MRTFQRVANRIPGVQGSGSIASADHINELQEAVEEVSNGPLRTVVTPFEHGGVGDGVTDDYAAVRAAYAAIPETGGILDLAGRKWYCGQPLDLDLPKAVTVDGGSLGGVAAFMLDAGAGLIFPQGSDGVIARGAGTGGTSFTSLRNFSIATDEAVWNFTPPGTGVGLNIETALADLDRIAIHGFGGDGLYIGSHPEENLINSNLGIANHVTVWFCGGHGIHLNGSDSNVWQFNAPNVVGNQGYGIKNDAGYQGVFIAAHADANVLGDYYDNSWSSTWISPYSEMNGKFVFGPDSRDGRLNTGLGGPSLWTDDGTNPIYEGCYLARGWRWDIVDKGSKSQFMRIQTNVVPANRQYFEIAGDSPGNGQFDIRIHDENPDAYVGSLANAWYDGADQNWKFMAEKLAFFGGTPTTKPVITGATTDDKLDSLIAAIAGLGLATDGTT